MKEGSMLEVIGVAIVNVFIIVLGILCLVLTAGVMLCTGKPK